ncbi:cation channel sperm-associated targeting subunit tau isoform X3 [Ascaphus truei]|uniref:cation channel sperm-associated targeting subunit tau isoform X3 n=1 Tax=Ascaphus truei TaxID=8439 RepID=UPI003F5A1C92
MWLPSTLAPEAVMPSTSIATQQREQVFLPGGGGSSVMWPPTLGVSALHHPPFNLPQPPGSLAVPPKQLQPVPSHTGPAHAAPQHYGAPSNLPTARPPLRADHRHQPSSPQHQLPPFGPLHQLPPSRFLHPVAQPVSGDVSPVHPHSASDTRTTLVVPSALSGGGSSSGMSLTWKTNRLQQHIQKSAAPSDVEAFTSHVENLVPCGKAAGCLAVQVKQCTNFNNCNIRPGTNLLIRIIVNNIIKCTKPQPFIEELKASIGETVIRFPDVKYFTVQVPKHSSDERNKITLEIIGLDGQLSIPRLFGRTTVHLFQIIEKGSFTQFYDMMLKNTINCKAEIELTFSYGCLGYGYSHQLKHAEKDLKNIVDHSIFVRIPPPKHRTDVHANVITAQPMDYPALLSPDLNVNVGFLDVSTLPDTQESKPAEMSRKILDLIESRNRLEQMKKEYRTLNTWEEKAEYLDKEILRKKATIETDQRKTSYFKLAVEKLSMSSKPSEEAAVEPNKERRSSAKVETILTFPETVLQRDAKTAQMTENISNVTEILHAPVTSGEMKKDQGKRTAPEIFVQDFTLCPEDQTKPEHDSLIVGKLLKESEQKEGSVQPVKQTMSGYMETVAEALYVETILKIAETVLPSEQSDEKTAQKTENISNATEILHAPVTSAEMKTYQGKRTAPKILVQDFTLCPEDQTKPEHDSLIVGKLLKESEQKEGSVQPVKQTRSGYMETVAEALYKPVPVRIAEKPPASENKYTLNQDVSRVVEVVHSVPIIQCSEVPINTTGIEAYKSVHALCDLKFPQTALTSREMSKTNIQLLPKITNTHLYGDITEPRAGRDHPSMSITQLSQPVEPMVHFENFSCHMFLEKMDSSQACKESLAHLEKILECNESDVSQVEETPRTFSIENWREPTSEKLTSSIKKLKVPLENRDCLRKLESSKAPVLSTFSTSEKEPQLQKIVNEEKKGKKQGVKIHKMCPTLGQAVPQMEEQCENICSEMVKEVLRKTSSSVRLSPKEKLKDRAVVEFGEQHNSILEEQCQRKKEGIEETCDRRLNNLFYLGSHKVMNESAKKLPESWVQQQAVKLQREKKGTNNSIASSIRFKTQALRR